ncbi:mitochondrial nicotinamide adenine dinucleotide transporter SLC25A51 [Onthophagus taurus]|uniref:mitochondrial nicotinamide adenine dinucleotide transporter SLC25A51 n=1 Tax=Onthophagus taurus TaxID=166361 RepID=UPI000C207F29|nr:solute carrier family 25 member 51 [Onthophagus taurus]
MLVSKISNDHAADTTSCVQETTTMATTTTRTIVDWRSQCVPEWREFLCGCGSAIINITITYPINKLIFRQMLHGVKAHSAFRDLRHEGIYFLYRGMLPPMLQKSLSFSIMFGVYDEVKRPLSYLNVNSYIARTIAGLVAGSLEAVFTPFERIQTLLQDSTYHLHFRNTFDAVKVIGINYGLKEYYRGAHAIVLRNGPANACFFILREELSCYIPAYSSEIVRTLFQFICGASIGAGVSCLFYPLNVGKVSLQSKVGGTFDSIFTTLPKIYRERGSKLRYVYRGVHVNCTRSFISWGVINVAYENIKKFVYEERRKF